MITIMTKESKSMRVFEIDTDDHEEAIKAVKEHLPTRHSTPILAVFTNTNPAKESLT